MKILTYGTVPPADGATAAKLAQVALREGSVLKFTYAGVDRVVEPHVIGLSTKDGSLVMRGWLIGDDRPWRLFTLAKAEGVFIDDLHTSQAPREGYVMGDKQMSAIITEIEV